MGQTSAENFFHMFNRSATVPECTEQTNRQTATGSIDSFVFGRRALKTTGSKVTGRSLRLSLAPVSAAFSAVASAVVSSSSYATAED